MRNVGWTAAALAAGFAVACGGAPREPSRTAHDDGRDTARETPVAARDDGRGSRRCGEISGYLRDPSPDGREVHAEPAATSPVLGRIAPPAPEENGGWAVSFRIHETRDGWLLVEGAGDDPVLTETAARPMYSGRGWIRGDGVSVGVQASQVFAEPRHASDLVVQADPSHTLEGVGEMVAVLACQGDWVLARWKIREPGDVRYHSSAVVSRDPLVLEGWTTGICNIQETSCDMPPGDRPSPPPPER